MPAKIDITELRFGRLIVSRELSKKRGKELLWECVCDCGGTKITTAASLKGGYAKSCDCIKREVLAKRNSKHGMSKSRIYEIWMGVIKRCTNQNCMGYKYYGGRGIKVCDRWMSFINFYNDTINGYSDELSLDRFPNTNGDYEPTNFRWATYEQQANNKTDTHLIEHNGKALTVSQWAKEVGVPYRRLLGRISKGWDIGVALSLPKQKITNNRRHFKDSHVYIK